MAAETRADSPHGYAGAACDAVDYVASGAAAPSVALVVVGGVGGAYAGHEVAGKEQTARSSTYSSSTAPSRYDPTTVRNVQQALNDKGYDAGPIDGQWGPNTEEAVRRFQQASGLPPTGELEGSTLSALGVAPAR